MKFKTDRLFHNLISFLQGASRETIEETMKSSFLALPASTRSILETYFVAYPYWGRLHTAGDEFDFFHQRAEALSGHCGDVLWLYEHLGDYRSKITLYQMLGNWLYFRSIQGSIEGMYSQYFDLDLIKSDENEVFIDAGAYVGDTALSFIGNYGPRQYKRIYCYEITPSVIARMEDKLAAQRDIVIRPCGLSDRRETVYLSPHSDVSANRLKTEGDIPAETVTLDEDVTEPVTFIKMDIEGAEQRALAGCKAHIAADRPKLAIAVYHNNEDLWKIPRMIDAYAPGYTFYLRYHGGPLFPTELILTALPT